MLSIKGVLLTAVLMTTLTAASFSIQGIDTTKVYASNVAAELGLPFSLKINQGARIESADLGLTLLNVTEDSRCPSDVTCVSAGQVTVIIELKSSTEVVNQSLTQSGGQAQAKQFANHSIKLLDVQPYPISTKKISPSDYVATFAVDFGSESRSALVTAEGSNIAIVAGWSVEKGIGAAVLFMHDIPKRVVVKFVPFYSSSCTHGPDPAQCIDGQVIFSNDINFADNGQKVHAEIDNSKTHLFISSTGEAGQEQMMNLIKFKVWIKPISVGGNYSTVSLQEGQRDGPLLVQKIYADRIEGLNFREYPIATGQGFPIIMRIGENASNGCTVTLTLLKIEDGTATFLKKVDERRPCPICWLQQALIGIR